LLAVSAALLVLMQWIGPGGAIVDLELAWSPQRAMAAIAGFEDIAAARIQVAVDVVFIAVLSLGLAGAIRRVCPPASSLRSLATVLVAVYAAADLLENGGLLLMMGSHVGGTVTRATTVAAVLKFAAVAAVGGIVVVRAAARAAHGSSADP
jgi:hypothetical protein